MQDNKATFFAPQLYIENGTHDISFYIKGFGAVELRRFSNDDGSIHVSELSVNGNVFHLHEIGSKKEFFSPGEHLGTTVLIGLFVADVDAVMNSAVAAGATIVSPAQDHDYGYRQGELRDPFGHYWLIEKKI